MTENKILSYVLRGKNRVKVLQAIGEEQKISKQIEKLTGIYKSHVSRSLRELQEIKLVKCNNPKERNFKFYELTTEGKKVLAEVNKICKAI